jgi:hypothetical protein
VFKNVVVDLPVVVSHYCGNTIMNSNLQQINQQFNQGLNQINGVSNVGYPMQQQQQQQYNDYPTEEQVANQGNINGVPPTVGGYPNF